MTNTNEVRIALGLTMIFGERDRATGASWVGLAGVTGIEAIGLGRMDGKTGTGSGVEMGDLEEGVFVKGVGGKGGSLA